MLGRGRALNCLHTLDTACVQGLQERFDLSKVPMLGSSSGALVVAVGKSGAVREIKLKQMCDYLVISTGPSGKFTLTKGQASSHGAACYLRGRDVEYSH